jgi:protein involved in temperature-dependent protein secretion
VGHQRRAIEVAPHRADYRGELVSMLVEDSKWDEARPHAREWLRLSPGSAAARQGWMMCLAKEGNKAEARRQMELLRKLRPANLPDVERWFARHVAP